MTRWRSARSRRYGPRASRCPNDVSVVGFDDVDLAPYVDPPLTTVHQPIRRKGEEAVELLLAAIGRRDGSREPEHRVLETRLIVRASTGPVPTVRDERRHARPGSGTRSSTRSSRTGSRRADASRSPARWSRGRRPRRRTGSRAATCVGSPSDSTTSTTSASTRCTSTRSSRQPRTTATTRTTTSRSTRCSAATTPCASCWTRPTRAACGSSSMASSTTRDAASGPFHHILETGAASPYRDWFHLDREVLDAGRPPLAYPPPGTDRRRARLQGVVGPAGPAEAEHRPSRGARVPVRRRRALAALRRSMAGGSTSRRRSTTRRSGRSSGGDAGRSGPMPTSSARSGGVAPDWLRGDRFDALMNYPLGEAILGFAGGPRLDMAVVDDPSTSIDGASDRSMASSFRRRVMRTRVRVRPGRRGRPAQPPRFARHAAAADRARRRRGAAFEWPSCPGDAARSPVRLLRRRGRAWRWERSGVPWAPSRGTRARWEPGLRESVRALLRLRRPSRHFETAPLRVAGAGGAAVAFERGAGASRFVVAANAGEERSPAGDPIRRASRSAPAARSSRSNCPGSAVSDGATIVDGGATIELAGRSGAVLRVT